MSESIFEDTQLVIVARAIAVVAHYGQVDKNGVDYIKHPERVGGSMYSVEGKAAGLLHDVIEDTSVTAEALLAAFIPARVVEAVVAVSHAANEPRADYLARIVNAGVLAIDVKLADMRDNIDETRLAYLDERVADRLRAKYRPGIEFLLAERATRFPLVMNL